ncbi:rhomboid family intramembrane serine protease [Aestuariirhabdus sp. Z084]|uniref:rhomboid family intramembrane serine protease n=1 Tax=Aestuariirhabdus haliotis TaxID=2918751 RepID=UPI00201B43DA|nr:rhomboid family intramembrane serine protease [Aestuariirhabdus haliotis]MCL6414723.1 rhomboid family intramembrane serine protease [Aestuariirhabdus haliotis]MCL6418655.1 rhomboid family intramembrane serine protease [Aestuariirhabdus haliotis]
MIKALSTDSNRDLGPFSRWLWKAGLPHRISEERGQQVLWVADDRAAQVAREALMAYERGELEGVAEEDGHELAVNLNALFQMLVQHPVTIVLILVTAVISLLTGFGGDARWVHWLSFVDFELVAGFPYFVTIAQSLGEGEYWRLLTPIFLHFSAIHLIFNMLWLFILGGRIEMHQGGRFLLLLILVTGLLSNVGQYVFSMEHPLFGGFSGVVYGLLGYCWIYSRFRPDAGLSLPRTVIGFMVGWLLICFTGILEVIGFGDIANAAHTIGLISGCALGGLLGFMHRQPESTEES